MAARHALLVAALLVVAGCNAPTTGQPSMFGDASTPTPAGTPAPAAYDIPVEGGTLPVDHERVYARTSLLLGTDVEPPARVRITDPEPSTVSSVSSSLPPVLRTLGVDLERRYEGGYWGVTRNDEVFVDRAMLNDTAATESTLAHEYAHVVQYRTRVLGDLYDTFDWDGIDQTLLIRAMIEGGASYTEDAYSRRYLPDSPSLASEVVRRYRERNSSGYRFFVAPYRYGYRYLEERFPSPRNLSVAYEDPPRTTEQLLYPSAGAEPPANLSVTVEETRWGTVSDGERVGELAIRLVLRTELNRTAAVRGADGWGEDRVYELERGAETSYAWVLRWDDRANATEFRRAFETYLDRRGTRTDAGWRVRNGSRGVTAFRVSSLDERTTVVLFGTPGFVTNATASAHEDGSVTIRTG